VAADIQRGKRQTGQWAANEEVNLHTRRLRQRVVVVVVAELEVEGVPRPCAARPVLLLSCLLFNKKKMLWGLGYTEETKENEVCKCLRLYVCHETWKRRRRAAHAQVLGALDAL
jgi:hypothetical protein